VTALNSSIMTFSTSTRKFNIDTSVDNVGNYSIKVIGTLGTYGSATFTFNIIIICELTTLVEGTSVAD
jgi:hypothetical protein